MPDSLTQRTVVVTGGCGFLGQHLVPLLAEQGATVRVIDTAPAPDWLKRLDIGVTRADVSDAGAVREALAGADTVVHAAFAPPSQPAGRLRSVNVDGTRALCIAAASARQVIVVSSTIVTAAPRRHPLFRDAPLSRLDAYRATRLEAEEVALAAASGSLRVAVVRPKTFVGPGRVGGFALLFDLIRAGRAVPIAGPGTNRYQLLDVRDLAAALRALVARGGDGTYELGATRFGSIADDLQTLITAAGTGARLRPLPAFLGRAMARGVELAGLAPLAEWHHCTARGVDCIVDVARARDELGWHPEHSNAESLIDAYRWSSLAPSEATTTHPVPRSHRGLRRLSRALR